ncbi:MAG: hypothetical protein LQ352_004429 [Teloschistes flavicans]|nr:MAG: hypothetical protein LQ352_004429 [Teloschistes flavicans]
MKYEAFLFLLAFGAINQAAPIGHLLEREVPQEHSHNTFLESVTKSLRINNPDNIGDAVFGLLGNAAAAAGQGSITNTDCLHQATADQAFTNAKAAGDVIGMTDALIYAALERNTGKVGLPSVACTAIKAKNPEIAAISQHQDPASPGAAAANKAVTLALAKQIASVGGDPQQALKSGTFAPGDVNDPTAKGNSCDTIDDEPGCIFTQNLLVEDATAAEISAAVAGTATSAGSAGPKVAAKPTSVTSSVGTENNTTQAAGNSTGFTASKSSTSDNVQTFTGSLGGPPPPVTSSASARPFSVNGATFVNSGAALQRSCSIQHNACANSVNSGKISGGVGQCDTQETKCNVAAKQTKNRKRALDFGSCSNPTIKFVDGLDGRKESAFAPINAADFNHGSALNIGVISGFICQQLQDKCKAGADATTACTKGQKYAATKTGQAAADAFNSALTGSSATTQVQGSGNATSATTSTIGTANSAIGGSNSSPAGAENGAAGSNIQTFTGTLGGPPPPVLQTSDARPFSVNGNTFVNAAAALQRSCDIQHNACANAANSGKMTGGVGQCETQQKACAAAGAGGK